MMPTNVANKLRNFGGISCGEALVTPRNSIWWIEERFAPLLRGTLVSSYLAGSSWVKDGIGIISIFVLSRIGSYKMLILFLGYYMKIAHLVWSRPSIVVAIEEWNV